MTCAHDSSRRTVVAALAGLPLFGLAPWASGGSRAQLTDSRTLVAYFSRSRNTRVVAGLIHRALGTDLFEILPAKPYPEDYLETVKQARQERDSGYEPALQARFDDMAA